MGRVVAVSNAIVNDFPFVDREDRAAFDLAHDPTAEDVARRINRFDFHFGRVVRHEVDAASHDGQERSPIAVGFTGIQRRQKIADRHDRLDGGVGDTSPDSTARRRFTDDRDGSNQT